MTTTRLNDTSGLGIIEVLIAILFFSVVAAGLLRATVGATKGNLYSRNVGAASALVYDKVEQLRSLDVATAPPDLEEGTHHDPLNPLTATGQPNGDFTRTWQVTKDVPRHGLSEVVITVRWPGIGTSSVRGTTYVCNTPSCA